MRDLTDPATVSVTAIDLTRLRGLRLQAHVPHRSYRVGDRVGKGVGGRMEFVDHRPYAPGDDLRRVDWNAAARTDRLVVKRHAHDSALPVHLAVDLSRSMAVGAPNGLGAARAIARGLAFVALNAGATVVVVGLTHTADTLARVSRRAGISGIEAALASMEPQDDADIGRAMRTYASRARDTGVFVLLSDMLDESGARTSLRALEPFEAAAVHLVPAALYDAPPTGPLRIQDAETGRARDIAWDDNAAAAYARRRDGLLREIPRVASALGIRYASVRTDEVGPDVFLKNFRNAGIVA
ncbi:DUF58 domain-containing protein [Candidatus Poribacteria bacterium]|nr:DUF58 domain-containing protein [Candidatus Poribacteria bacterium]MBT5714984.1 DUF58 domain-containing protein [Candidatus Poribacteria bacterium]MBT7806920.1 DUF58 domain-containing protein [Candidatus Poribacteria bacterium]